MEPTTATVDQQALETKVKAMYRDVAQRPDGEFHFELGGDLARRLGYPDDLLSRVPEGALESFAGVGYFFDLAELGEGESVLDLGSGSGTDVFCAAALVGPRGRVVGVDFTPEQIEKGERLASVGGHDQVEFRRGSIADLPVEDASFDCVISNGVINLSPDKPRIFREAARALRPGGRLAISDIVTEAQLTDKIVADADLWASCIGGAAQEDTYRGAIEAAGLEVVTVHDNPYEFISQQALDASAKYGVKSVSLLARKPD